MGNPGRKSARGRFKGRSTLLEDNWFVRPLHEESPSASDSTSPTEVSQNPSSPGVSLIEDGIAKSSGIVPESPQRLYEVEIRPEQTAEVGDREVSLDLSSETASTVLNEAEITAEQSSEVDDREISLDFSSETPSTVIYSPKIDRAEIFERDLLDVSNRLEDLRVLDLEPASTNEQKIFNGQLQEDEVSVYLNFSQIF